MGSPEADSVQYYEHNAEAYAKRTFSRLDLDALNRFVGRLPGNAKVYDAGCGAGRDLKFFASRELAASGCDASERMVRIASRESGVAVQRADLRLLSLARGELDGIWAHRSFVHLSDEGCRRVMATFFSALKPSGILFLSFDEGEGTREDRTDDPEGPTRTFHLRRIEDMASLTRQHGFQLLETGRSTDGKGTLAILAQRLI